METGKLALFISGVFSYWGSFNVIEVFPQSQYEIGKCAAVQNVNGGLILADMSRQDKLVL